MCVAGPPGRISRPRWSRLYALGVLGVSGLAAVHASVPSGPLLTLADSGLVLAFFSAMGLWVQRNRAAIEQQESCDCSWERMTVRVIPSRRPAVVSGPSPRRTRRISEDEQEEEASVVGRGAR